MTHVGIHARIKLRIKKIIMKTISLKKKLSNQRAFTLIELIIVIGILAIVATVLLAVIDPLSQAKKANDGRRKSDLSQIQKALEQYYQDYGGYPLNADTIGCTYQIRGNNGDGDDCISWGQSWQPYMNVLPRDPSGSKNYVYYAPSSANGQSYYLYANLDRGGNDPQACNNNGAACLNVPGGADCGGTCNYGVSSPNVSP